MRSSIILLGALSSLAMAAPQSLPSISQPGHEGTPSAGGNIVQSSTSKSFHISAPIATPPIPYDITADLASSTATATDSHYSIAMTFTVATPTAAVAGKLSSSLPPTIANVTLDRNGFFHLGDDGVYRSYAANGTVLSAVPLSNDQIFGFLARFPSWYKPMGSYLNNTFAGVDGNNVPEQEMFHPSEHILPHEFQADPDGDAGHEDPAVDQAYGEYIASLSTADQTANPALQLKRQSGSEPLGGLNPNWICAQVRCGSTLTCEIAGCYGGCGYPDRVIQNYKVCAW